MAGIFIGYSNHDRGAAQVAAAHLSAHGHTVFANPSVVRPGGTTIAGVGDAIQGADVVVFLWSANAAQSEWVRKEIEIALDAWSEGKLVLVRLDDTALPPGLRDLAAISVPQDSEIGVVLPQIESAVARIAARPPGQRARHLGTSRAAYAQPAPSPPPPKPRASGKRSPALATVLLLAVLLGAANAVFFSLRMRGNGGAVSITPYIFYALAVLVVAAAIYWFAVVLGRRVGAGRQQPPRTVAASAPEPDGRAIDVFISFSTKDKKSVETLVDAMKEEGLSAWIYHKDSATDTTYPGPIVDAVWACRKVAVMCSDNAFRSDDVVREMHVAKRARKPLVAFFLDRKEAPARLPGDFEYFLPGYPWIFVQALGASALKTELRRTLAT